MTGPGKPSVVRQMRHLVPAPLRLVAARFVADQRAAEVERTLAALAADSRPIAIGPWTGEVGFELLYWVPFVRRFAEHYRVSPDRLIAVTRGGAAAWYAPFAAHAVDALAFMGPDEFRTRNEERHERFGEQKQVALAGIDADILELVRRQRGHDVAVLHPSLMYRMFGPYWFGHQPISWVRRRMRHQRFAAPSIALDLPPAYTAVKFYFNDCFRATPENRAMVARIIRELEREGPVISLSTGLAIDDHPPCDPDVAALPGIRDRLKPATNLLVQSAIVARARRFVGTYGGFAYLAPFYGVPAFSYFSEPDGFSIRHLDLVQDVLAGMPGAGELHVAPLTEALRS